MGIISCLKRNYKQKVLLKCVDVIEKCNNNINIHYGGLDNGGDFTVSDAINILIDCYNRMIESTSEDTELIDNNNTSKFIETLSLDNLQYYFTFDDDTAFLCGVIDDTIESDTE